MPKSLSVICLVAASFVLPSPALASARGAFFCCAPEFAAPARPADAAAPGGSAAGLAPAAGRHGRHGEAGKADATVTADARAAPEGHAGGHAAHSHSGSGGIARDTGPGAGPGAGPGVPVQGPAGAAPAPDPGTGHAACDKLTCAGSPAFSFPEISAPLFARKGMTPYILFSSPLPAPPARSLFRPPRL